MAIVNTYAAKHYRERNERYEDLQRLRELDSQHDRRGKPIFLAMWQEICFFASTTFCQRKDSMCKYYGHVTRKDSWKMQAPVCSDCGAPVTTAEQLRKATSL